jgi:hypothetical protein
MRRLLYFISAASAGLIFYSLRENRGLFFFNVAPLAIAVIPLVLIRTRAKECTYAAYGFSATIVAALSINHVSYILQLGTTSTSSLMFVFLPISSLILGCLGALAGVVIGLLQEFSSNRRAVQ